MRYLGNRSSGRMGCAVARKRSGWACASPGVRPGESSRAGRVEHRGAQCRTDAGGGDGSRRAVRPFIATAAVADFRPREASLEKIKKRGDGGLTRSWYRIPTSLRKRGAADRPFVVGFAAETHDVERYARDKLERKRLDMIAANRVGEEGSGFDADCNA